MRRLVVVGIVLFVGVVAGVACGGRTALFDDQPSGPGDDVGGSPDASSGDVGSGSSGGALGDARSDVAADGPIVGLDGGVLGLPSLCSAPLGLQPGSPWPIAQRCSARGGYTTVTGPRSATIGWRAPAKGTWSPDVVVAADGTVYAYDTARGVVALDANGKERWVASVPKPDTTDFLDGSLAIGTDGTVYAWNGDLTAIAPDGSVAWTSGISVSPAGGPGESNASLKPAVGPDGTIYITGKPLSGKASGVSIFAVRTSGETSWSHAWPYGITATSSPSVGPDGAVFLITYAEASGAAALTAFGADGSQSWNMALQAPEFAGSVVVTDEGVALVSCMFSSGADGTKGSLCSIVNGATIASSEAAPFWALSSSPATGQLLVNADELSAYSDDGRLLWSILDGIWPVLVDGTGSVFTSMPTDPNGGAQTIAIDSTAHTLWKTMAGVPLAFGADGTLYTRDSASQSIVALLP